MNLIIYFISCCISTTHSPVIFLVAKPHLRADFPTCVAHHQTRSVAVACWGISDVWPTYFEDKIWVQVRQNGSLVPTCEFPCWFSCQEGVEFRGSAASKTSEHPIFKAWPYDARRTYDWFMILIVDCQISCGWNVLFMFCLILDLSIPSCLWIGFLDPCWSIIRRISRKVPTSRAWGPCRIIESQWKPTMNIEYEISMYFLSDKGARQLRLFTRLQHKVLAFNTPRWKWTQHGRSDRSEFWCVNDGVCLPKLLYMCSYMILLVSTIIYFKQPQTTSFKWMFSVSHPSFMVVSGSR